MADALIYDLSFSAESIDTEDGLRTIITTCLLTRGRALPDDELADPSDRGGWWGDAYSDVPGRQVGSRLWTLKGRKINAAFMADMEQMIRECLQWLIDDGYIGGVELELEVINHGTIGARIGIRRPNTTTVADLGLWELSL